MPDLFQDETQSYDLTARFILGFNNVKELHFALEKMQIVSNKLFSIRPFVDAIAIQIVIFS